MMSSAINDAAQAWWAWMWPMFWQVGLLIVLIAVIERLARHWMYPQLRMALWMLVMVKLVLPPGLTSPLSVTARLLDHEALAVVSPTGPCAETGAAATTADGAGHLGAPLPTSGAQTSPATATPLSALRLWAMVLWALGLCACAMAALVRYRRLRGELQLQGTGRRPSAWLLGKARTAARTLRLGRVPEVIISDTAPGPAVFGIWRPVVILPSNIHARMSSAEIDHVMLHELAHVKRRDAYVHTAVMALQMIYWINPLIWLAARRIRNLRELCCDDTVAAALRESTPAYRATLLRIARELVYAPAGTRLGFLGLIVQKNNIVARLNWLERNAWRRAGRLQVLTALSVAAMIVFVLPMTRPSGARAAAVGAPAQDPTPGAALDVLRPLAGDWDVTARFRLSPDGPLVISRGTGHNRWILDGNFLQHEVEGQGMMGTTFKGLGVYGYNRAQGQYTAMWLENMATSMMQTRGSYDPDTRTFHLAGEAYDAVSAQTRRFRSEIHVVSDDHYQESYYDITGPEFEIMTVDCRRR